MVDIVLKANRKTPGITTIGNDLESHTRALQAIAEAIAIHERRTKNLLASFVRVEELVDLGVLDLEGTTLTLGDDLGGGGGSVEWDDILNVPALVDDLGDLSDPGADRIVFWDDSDGNLQFLQVGTGLQIVGTTLSVTSGSGGPFEPDIYLPQVGDLIIYDGYGWVNMPSELFPYTLEELILSANPTAFWKLNESSGTFVDFSGNAFNLTSINNVTYQASYLIPSLPKEKFARFNATTGSADRPGVLGTSPPLNGSWSYECVFMCTAFTSDNCGLLRMGASGETEVTNFQVLPYIASAGQPSIYWERAAGTDTDNISTTNLVEGKAYHMGFVKDGDNNLLHIYVNGLHVVTMTYLNANEPTGGTSVNMLTGIGATASGSTSTFVIGYAAFYNGRVLNAGDFADHARAAGLFGV